MEDFVVKNKKKLRFGFTTGSCATAAAKAATIMLVTNNYINKVKIDTRIGKILYLDIVDIKRENHFVSCAVIKDSGDDPDVTNGIKIFATVSKIPKGILIDGGTGVGLVTKSGLQIPVGNAAINKTPLETIKNEALKICKENNYKEGLKIIISVPDGKDIAKKTMNSRLGILNGISILGTTGIVEPMSEKAIIDTIKSEIDIHISNGEKHLFITPGNYGRDFAKTNLNIDIDSFIKCSNFIGETLDYAEFIGIKEITLVGHAGKLVKIAGGTMNTHSKVADCRMEIIAAHSAMIGASRDIIKKIMTCTTTDMAQEILKKYTISNKVWNSIGEKIKFHLNERTRGHINIKFIVFSQEYGILFESF